LTAAAAAVTATRSTAAVKAAAHVQGCRRAMPTTAAGTDRGRQRAEEAPRGSQKTCVRRGFCVSGGCSPGLSRVVYMYSQKYSPRKLYLASFILIIRYILDISMKSC
jgi:hypothetical protein